MDGSPCKKPVVQRTLSSLSSQINEWHGSTNSKTVGSLANKKRRGTSRRTDMSPGFVGARCLANNLPWYMKYTPQSLADVAIHKHKLKEVEGLLESMLSGESNYKVLLLSGPSGCSKSTVVKLLADLLVPKYRERSFNTLQRDRESLGHVIEYSSSSSTIGTSNMNSLGDFLTQSTLRVGSNLALLLVEDLPNVFHKDTRYIFQRTILRWLCSGDDHLPPLVICLTECEINSGSNSESSFNVDNQFIAETIFGREILSHPLLVRVKFNPINTTLINRHLKKIATNERVSFSEEKWKRVNHYIKELSQHCGDIRSAIAALEFWATSSMTEQDCGTTSLTREQSISYFHVVGRIIYGSKDLPDDNKMINELMGSNSLLSGENLKLGLLENYSSFNKQQFPLRDAESILNAMSLSDVIGDRSTYSTLPESLEYSCRKVRNVFSSLHSNGQNVNPMSHGRLNFPRESKVKKCQLRFRQAFDEYHDISFYKYRALHTFKDTALLFGFYAPLIRKKRSFKKKALTHYLTNLKTKSADQIQIKAQHKDTFCIDDTIDIISRIGKELVGINSTKDVINADEEETNQNIVSNFQKMKKLENLRKKLVFDLDFDEGSTANEFELDPVIDSDLEVFSSDDDDDDDDDIYEILASQSPRKTINVA